MDLHGLKLKMLGIEPEKFGNIFTFVDYGNVNYWYDKDERNAEGQRLPEERKLMVDIEKLANFTRSFSAQMRFYYGWDERKRSSWHLAIKAERCGFIKNTKPIQFIRHYVGSAVIKRDGKITKKDSTGTYVEIPKSNFDVEISVDAVRLLGEYDTFCLFSGDSDFSYLVRFLKRNGKKFIVIASGQVFHTLREVADLYINAQRIKADITSIKELAPLAGRELDIGSASGGQGSHK